jgi:hypothetical protein
MFHQMLNRPRRRAGLISKRRTLASQRMKIKKPACVVFVRNAGGRKINLEHFPAAGRQRKCTASRRATRQVIAQILNQIGSQSESCSLPVLGVSARDFHERRAGLQVE